MDVKTKSNTESAVKGGGSMETNLTVAIVGNDCHITIQGEDKLITIKASLGAKYLQFLHNNSNRAYSPVRLRNIISNGVDFGMDAESSVDIGHKDISYNFCMYDFIPSSDYKTIKDVRARIRKINIALLEASNNNDLTRTEELYDELEKLEHYLDETICVNGVMKNLEKSNRNDFYSIKRAIQKSIKEVEAISSYLANLLRKSISMKMNEIVFRK